MRSLRYHPPQPDRHAASRAHEAPRLHHLSTSDEGETVMFDNEEYRLKSADLPIPTPFFPSSAVELCKGGPSLPYLSIPYHLPRDYLHRNPFQALVVLIGAGMIVMWSGTYWQAVQMLVGYAVVLALVGPWVRRKIRQVRRLETTLFSGTFQKVSSEDGRGPGGKKKGSGMNASK